MVSDFISDKAPLFYYSFRQVRTTNDGKEEYHDASKVTIRKNNDYGNNGLQFSVFNVIRYGEHWQSDGINQTRIDRETFDRVDFYGKGEDSNRLGVFLYKKALIHFPAPRFFVFYDGDDHSEPVYRTMKLSDSFDGDSSSLKYCITRYTIQSSSKYNVCHSGICIVTLLENIQYEQI